MQLVPVVVGLLEPPAVADDGVVCRKADTAAAAGASGTSPRIGVVFGLWQCDKENHGWREGLPLTVACQVSI